MSAINRSILLAWFTAAVAGIGAACSGVQSGKAVEGRVQSSDGVSIVYTTRGSSPTALVFIHGGLADRSFWDLQLSTLGETFQVVALDLAGHGASGSDRQSWTVPAFAQDVRAVVEVLNLRHVVLIGNSLGGPVALEAARLLPGRVLGAIGIDTFHDLVARIDSHQFQARAAAFREDFAGTCSQMVGALFHPGKQLELREWARKRMCSMAPEIAAGLMKGLAGCDLPAAVENAGVPIRAINGDLWPTNVEENRTLAPDFEVALMSGAGHYPMLERPEEFNRLLVAMVAKLMTVKAHR